MMTLNIPAYAIAEQAEWEVEGTRRAAAAYREAVAKCEDRGDFVSLTTSQKLLRELVPPLTDRIRAHQEDALSSMGDPRQSRRRWAVPILTLEADKLAFITISSCLGVGSPYVSSSSLSLASLCTALADAVQDEVEFNQWAEQQREARKAAKESKVEDHIDLLKIFEKRFPAADRRTWKRWRAKIGAMKSERWETQTSVALGGELIGLLLESAPHRFGKEEVGRKAEQRGTYVLTMTKETQEMLQDIHARAELARPYLMPMICPPIPWRYDTSIARTGE